MRRDLNENSFESTLRINFNIVLTVRSNIDIGAKIRVYYMVIK